MPVDFEKCRANGGEIRTISLPEGKYIHICYDKNGQSYRGEVKTKKKKK
jgi:hypothetical protein